MKHKTLLIFLISLISLAACNQASEGGVQLTYTVDEFNLAEDYMQVTVQLANKSATQLKGGKWELHWNQLKGFVDSESLPDGIDFEWVNGAHYFVLKFDEQWGIPPGGKIAFSMKQTGVMDRLAMGPIGVFTVQEQQTIDVETQVNWEQAKGLESLGIPSAQERYDNYKDLKKIKSNELSWVIPSPVRSEFNQTYRKKDTMWSFEIDEYFKNHTDKMMPFVKGVFKIKIKINEGPLSNFQILHDPELEKESYQLSIKEKVIVIKAADYSGVVYGLQSLRQISDLSTREGLGWPLIEIVDVPRYGYRGFLLDIARNFYGPEKIKEVLDLMSLFKLNRLDFRLTDDEGWRIEIAGLPELTAVGSRRGYAAGQDDRLLPMYGSGADGGATANGYLSRADFIDILKYAQQRAIEIMPQISFPSHARAAIKAMDYRYLNKIEEGNLSEAKKYHLSDPEDKSQYRSAQNYNDNIICICRESAYDFYEKVVDEIVSMYREANVPIDFFSIGADELPYGVWTASPICKDFINNNKLGISDVNRLYEYNLKRLKSLLEDRKLTMTGWEDILLDHSEKSQEETQIKSERFDYEVIPYVWNNSWGEGREDMIYKFANMGFKTVMSNSSAFYFDMTDDKDMENHGLNWSGYVNYKDAWGTDPDNVFANHSLNRKHGITAEYISEKEKLKPEMKSNLLGIQSQLWTETVRSSAIFDELLLPNLIVFSERAWAKQPEWVKIVNPSKQTLAMNTAWNLFANTLGQRILPMINSQFPEFAYDLPKPGAIIEKNKLKVGVAFPGLEVRYTTNGKIPSKNDPLYLAPVYFPEDLPVMLRTFDILGRGGRPITVKK